MTKHRKSSTSTTPSIAEARSAEHERAARIRALIAEMTSDPVLREVSDDPWEEVRDRSPGRPPPSFR